MSLLPCLPPRTTYIYDCGWYAELYFKVIPYNLKSSLQKWLKNTLALSETMERGSPCNLTTSLVKITAIDGAENGYFRLIKCVYLLRRSTTTKIESNPSERGNLSIKSIKTSSQTWSRMGNSWSKPAGARLEYLCC